MIVLSAYKLWMSSGYVLLGRACILFEDGKEVRVYE